VLNQGRLRVSVVGGSGYAGGELLRILLGHPRVQVQQVTSNRQAGQPVTLSHPNLRGLTSLTFVRAEEIGDCDLLFLALPNGESMQSMEMWMTRAERVIDLGADFRLRSAEEWTAWYGTEHAAPHLLPHFTYGVPEISADQIRNARHVAGPGCEAIVSILCLYPLVRRGILKPDPIIIDAKMGSSQAGHAPTDASHHPERAGAVRSYKPTGHRHAAEIQQVFRNVGLPASVCISATAVEMVRGVLVTIHGFAHQDLTEQELWRAFRSEYSGKPFVRIVKQTQGLYRYPEPKILQGTNYCEIGFEKERRSDRVVIIGAIDNLVKGTSGNGVQCMNLMCGFPETMGLEFPGLHPV